MAATDEQQTPDIRFLGGQPSTADIAAVTAVLTATLDQLAGESRRSRERGQSAWQVSQRPIRRPIPHGTWRNVEG